LSESLVLLALVFACKSRNQEDKNMVRFVKWRVRESSVCVSVCGVKVVSNCFFSGCHVTCW
jgi:hypothetical protein